MKRLILIVDDEPNIRFLYKDLLETHNYQVIEAEDGVDAFHILEKNTPDLIILDIKMPKMDGLEFLARLRESNSKIPVILCTAYSQYKQDLGSWAADRYIIKSSNLSELVKTVKELLPEV